MCSWRDAFFRLQRPNDGGCVCLWAWSFVVPGTHAGSGCGSWRKHDSWSSQRATATGSVAVGSLRRPVGGESKEPFRWRSSRVEYEGLERFRPRGVCCCCCCCIASLLACWPCGNISQPGEPSALYGRAEVSARYVPRSGVRQYLYSRFWMCVSKTEAVPT